MKGYIVTKEEIDTDPGYEKVHFMDDSAQRINKSLGDLVGLQHLGFHLIEVRPGFASTEDHVHYFEEECLYILEGTAEAVIGEEHFPVKAGDFIGYRAGGLPHKLVNTGEGTLRCIVAGQRLDHDVADYTRKGKRLYRNRGLPWNLVDIDDISEPEGGRKR